MEYHVVWSDDDKEIKFVEFCDIIERKYNEYA
jgi:hypothetical protein